MAEELKQPESMFSIMAKLFAAVSKEVITAFGEEGEQAIRRGVRAFGIDRGRNIAAKAAADGKPNTVENYLPYYDMPRSELFDYETVYSGSEASDRIDQYFRKCPFSRAWIDTDTVEFGRLYCDEIDGALARGFNPNFEHEAHTHMMYGSQVCHMSFQMTTEP